MRDGERKALGERSLATIRQIALAAGFLAFAGLAWAQTPAGPPSADANAVAACRAEVAKFERAMGLVRQSAGNEMANRVREMLMPAKTQQEILMREGYCGLARYMQKHKLVDHLQLGSSPRQ